MQTACTPSPMRQIVSDLPRMRLEPSRLAAGGTVFAPSGPVELVGSSLGGGGAAVAAGIELTCADTDATRGMGLRLCACKKFENWHAPHTCLSLTARARASANHARQLTRACDPCATLTLAESSMRPAFSRVGDCGWLSPTEGTSRGVGAGEAMSTVLGVSSSSGGCGCSMQHTDSRQPRWAH